jgi:putative membrane protein
MDLELKIPSATIQADDPRVDMAIERTIMASVRTQLAWIRTVVGLITAGIAIDQGFTALLESKILTGNGWLHTVHFSGLFLTTTGTVLMLATTYHYFRFMKVLAKMKGRESSLLEPGLILSAIIAVIGILSVIFLAID